LLLFAPVANVLLRSFSDELLAGGALALRRRVARWCGWVGGLGLLGVALAWAVGPDWMARLFGAPYAEAGLLLPWVVAMLPFAWVNLVLGPWLAALVPFAWVVLFLQPPWVTTHCLVLPPHRKAVSTALVCPAPTSFPTALHAVPQQLLLVTSS
jgi:O-antigen/teichoic acid export membrane protein